MNASAKITIIFLIAICAFNKTIGNSPDCFKLPYPARNILIKEHIETELQTRDKIYRYNSIDAIKKIINRFKADARSNKDSIAIVYADVILFSHQLRLNLLSNASAEAQFKYLSKKSISSKSSFVLGTLVFNYSFHLLMKGKQVEFLLQQQNCFNIYNKLDLSNFPTKKYALYSFAVGHFNIDNLNSAINLAKYCEKLEPDILDTDIFNNHLLGKIYTEKKQFDSALYYYNKNLKKCIQNKNESWINISNGYIGLTTIKKSNYNSVGNSVDLVKLAFNFAIRNGLNSVAVEMGTLLSEIYIKEKDITNAAEVINTILKSSLKGVDPKIIFDFYVLCYTVNKLKPNFQNQVSITDSLILYQKVYFDSRNSKLSNYLNLLLEQQKLKAIKSESESQKTIFNLRLTLIGAVFIIAVFITSITLKKRVTVLKAKLVENKHTQIKLEQELQDSREQLKTFMAKQMAKGKILEKFIHELKNDITDEYSPDLITKLKSLTILTEEDWQKFRELFDQNYPGILVSIEKNIPEITQAELRYIALIKLNLKTKDMARMLGVGDNAIRSVKSRLLKKIPANLNLFKPI